MLTLSTLYLKKSTQDPDAVKLPKMFENYFKYSEEPGEEEAREKLLKHVILACGHVIKISISQKSYAKISLKVITFSF